MDKDRKETPKKKTYYTISDLRAELDTLQQKIEESSNKEKILNYLKDRLNELGNQ